MLEAVPTRQTAQLQAWRAVLEKLKVNFASQDDLKVKLTYVFQHEVVAQRGELTVGQYVGAVSQTYKQLKSSLRQLDQDLVELGSIREQVSFLRSYSPTHFSTWLTVNYSVGGSVLNQRFLGHYESLFDIASVPLPT